MTEKTKHPSEKDNTTVTSFRQDKKLVNKLRDMTAKMEGEVDYDVDKLEEFLAMVFHDEPIPDEHILTWSAAEKLSGYPMDVGKQLKTLSRITQPRALYFGTSTCMPEGNVLYNRKSLFKRLHVVVLDDIGTKVKAEDLPKDLTPTYIIESSKDNYQYGFVLETPIDNLEQATALIQLVYASGYSDEGGKMPTKIVRLPGGVNGKPGDKQMFHVELIKDDGPRWTPEKLLEVMDLGVSWDEVVADASIAEKRKGQNKAGTAPWMPAGTTPTLDGIVDPVLEWLYEEGKVRQEELNGWVSIECPWCDLHSDGDGTAGYSPLGYGGEHSEYRGFHCFHAHCKDQHAVEFLQWVASQGGPEAATRDLAADLVAEYAYDPINDCAWRIRDAETPTSVPLKGFNNVYGRTVLVNTADGKTARTSHAKLWMASPYRVDVYGQTFDPARPERLIDMNGQLMVNTFKQPNWGDGDIDAEDIAQFMDFMEYLIPIEEERTYFLDWLACKAQNLGFRGAAILMIAQSQGTGRTTLSDMLATLFSRVNTAHVPFPQLCKTDGQFNEWQEKPLVFTDETLSLGGESYYKVYETLKEIFDPRPKETWINPKYGRKRVVMCHSSYLMFSNHTNALATAVDDRRIYVIENAPVPWPGEKFAELNAWLDEKDADGKPYWAKAVWRWLQAREVDPNEMTKPAPKTAQKIAMSESTASPIEIVVRSVLNNYPLPVVNPHDIKTVCARVGHRINYTADSHSNGIVNRILRDMTRKTHESLKIRVGAKIVRPKLIVNNQLQSNTQIYGVADIGYTARGNLAAELKRVDIDELVTQAEEALDLMDL